MGGNQSFFQKKIRLIYLYSRVIEPSGPKESEMLPGSTKEDYEEESRREISRLI
jgi:hypothetical protein